jgi:signal transduction histidine kinase
MKRRSRAPVSGIRSTSAAPNDWATLSEFWQRGHLIRSFVWSQESTDETALVTQFLARIRRVFKVDFCFVAVHREDGKVAQTGIPEGLLNQLPVDFVPRCMELIVNSRIPLCWSGAQTKTDFQTVVVSPLSPAVGEPLGFLMLGHLRSRVFTNAELLLLQSLAGEVSWAIREVRSKLVHRKLLSAASLELKNSLNTVLRECALSRQSPSSASVAHGKSLSNIEKNTLEALRTIGSFLDTTIDQQGRLSVLRQPVNLVAMVEDTLNGCREKAGWLLETRYAKDLPRTYATDPARFRHVLRDLVEHAIAVAEQGPLLIRVRKNRDFIEINLSVSAVQDAADELAAESPVYSCYRGDSVPERLDTVRENLKLLSGHLHFVKLPDERFEIGLCLPEGEPPANVMCS